MVENKENKVKKLQANDVYSLVRNGVDALYMGIQPVDERKQHVFVFRDANKDDTITKMFIYEEDLIVNGINVSYKKMDRALFYRKKDSGDKKKVHVRLSLRLESIGL